MPAGGVFMPPSVGACHRFHLIEFPADSFKSIDGKLVRARWPANVASSLFFTFRTLEASQAGLMI